MTVNVRNSVVIALAQKGVLVIGILGVAASNKLASKMGYPSLGEYLFFINYGWLLMPVPADLDHCDGVVFDSTAFEGGLEDFGLHGGIGDCFPVDWRCCV